jgi:hypothetical protein
MAAEPSESYEDFVSQILRPTNLTDLKQPVKYEKVSILIYRDGGTNEPTEELEFENIYPFYTVADLSTLIYQTKELKQEFHPQNQCFLMKTRTENFVNLRYIFNKSNKLEFISPFQLVKSGKANPAFVDLEGNPQIQDITSRDHMLLDEVLFTKPVSKVREDDVYSIHLFLYSDVLSAYPGLRPINRVDWEGMFKIYFPEKDKAQEDGSLSNDVETYAPIRVQRFLERQKAVEKLDQLLLEAMPLRKPGESSRGDAINFANIRNLRFTWDKPPKFVKGYQAFRLENVFYDMPVSQIVPYIRYYPISNARAPISKIHVEGPLNIPTMEDPQILMKWSQERPLLPEEEFVVAKILIRPGSGSVHPLYASLNIFQDGSAMFSLQPNTDTKSLSKEADLYNLVPALNSVMASIPGLQPKLGIALPPLKIYSPETVSLTDAYVVLSLWLEKEDTEPITSKSLNKILPYFRAFFQVTASPIKEQNPIAFLRYKPVSNFQTPSRDFQFLIRVSDLQKIQGQTSLLSLVRIYKEEFDVSDEVAHRRVSAFINDREKYSMVNPETLEYTQKENPGIDIAIFGKHPFYTFHIYRVDSRLTLQRIKTLLSLLISVSPENFKEDSRHSAEVLEEEDLEAAASAEAEAAEEAEEAEEAEGEAEETSDVREEAKAIAVAVAAAGDKDDSGEAELFDDGLGDFDGFGEEEEISAVVAAPPQAAAKTPLQALISATTPQPAAAKATKGKTPAASASSGKAAAGKAAEAEADAEAEEADDITDISQIKQQPSRIYFRKRLQFYDKTLFSYSKTHPSLKKYPSMCAANALKQPTVMREDEFERMKDMYSKEISDGLLYFKEYPIKKGTAAAAAASRPPQPKGVKQEIITVLRYGSNLLPGQANIFICSEYWCRFDEIILLKSEFEKKGLDRKGRQKDAFMCPFCRGGLVKNRDIVIEGETVIQRLGKGKEADDKKHLYINFLKKTPHPQGLYLPCCFISDHAIDDSNPAFSPLKSKAEKLVKGEPVVPGFAADVQAAITEVPFIKKSVKEEVKIIAVDYKTTLTDIFSESFSDRPYIVGAEKLPLELTRKGPQIGIVPKGVDTYFTQDSLGTAAIPGLVVQDHTVWKLMTDNTTKKPNVTGFFRVAAENNKRNQAESFFAAIAPYFGENSAAKIKSIISSHIQPNLFLSLNYGNFLFDFYNPATPEPKQSGILREFTQKRLLMDMVTGTPKELITRAWKGFTAFDVFMRDTETTKEYRQFAQFLSLPNTLYWEDYSDPPIQRSNGILFIVLEVNRDNSVEVRCPPYGVSPAQTDPKTGCDIAFILHYYSGIWEPLFHIRSDPAKGIEEVTVVFARDAYASWPQIVKDRVAEFQKLCHSSGLGIYTDSPNISAKSLLPLSKAMGLADSEIHGIMRDIYNHVSFVIYKDQTTLSLVLVPVIDDGSVYPQTRVELEWRSIFMKLAKEDVVRKFYEEKIMPVLDAENPIQLEIYKPTRLMRLDKTDPMREYVYALSLGNNLHVPVKKSDAEAEEIEEGVETVWSIDRKIAFGSSVPDAVLTVDYRDFEEIYQHLRFSFANWFSLSPPSLKTQVNSILFKNGYTNMDLPLFEKRQRLSIILESEITSWLDSSTHSPKRNPSLKRIDCRVIVEEGGCKDRCVWKRDTNKCLLHSPQTFNVGNKEVPAIKLLITRLIEELIRFPAKRAELLEQRVSQYVKLTSAFRSGSQYIVPEDLPAWSEMLRMEWTKKAESRYIEEYTAIEPEEYIPEYAVPSFSTGSDPILKALVGDEYFFIEEPSGSIARIIEKQGIAEEQLEEEGQMMEAPIIDIGVGKFIAQKLKLSIYQMLYEMDSPVPGEPLIVKLQLTAKMTPAPFLCIVMLPDQRVGVISTSAEVVEPIPVNKLPQAIRKLLPKIAYTQLIV